MRLIGGIKDIVENGEAVSARGLFLELFVTAVKVQHLVGRKPGVGGIVC